MTRTHLHDWPANRIRSLCGAVDAAGVPSAPYQAHERYKGHRGLCEACVAKLPLFELADTDLEGSQPSKYRRPCGVCGQAMATDTSGFTCDKCRAKVVA